MNEGKLKGQCRDCNLGMPLRGVTVILLDKNDKEIARTTTNKKGFWEFDSDSAAKILFTKEKYVPKKIKVDESQKIVRLLEDTLICYTDKLWYRSREVIKFHVHSPVKFSATLVRYGKKIESVHKFGIFEPITQTVPDDFFVADGLKWQESFQFLVPENIKPGLYGIHLKPEVKGHPPYHASFVISVSPKKYGQNSKLLVIASTTTWQAYNVWGGRSRYRNFEDFSGFSLKVWIHIQLIKFVPEQLKRLLKKILKHQIVVSANEHPDAWQFKRLSLRRPHPNVSIYDSHPETKFTSHLAAGEWRVLAWLEKENFQYDMISGFDLHNDPDLLQNYQIVILNTHCEYWSKKMFAGLEKFYQNGGSVLNLSGNSIFREIDFLPNGDFRCISLSFHQTAADESQLLGVRFDMRGYQTRAPFRVELPSHWVFNGTNLKKGDLFAKNSLNMPDANKSEEASYDATKPGIQIEKTIQGDGGSGWETDKITATAPDDVILIAKGTNPAKGGADMIIREAKDGKGFVFSASSITFGGSLLVDAVSARIIKNILSRLLSERQSA